MRETGTLAKALTSRRKADIRAFRTKISKLKKAGIVSAKVDARKAKPSKHYKKLLKDYANVITGKQRTIKLKPKQAKHAKEFGIATRGRYAIVDNTPGMKVIRTKKDPFGYTLQFPDSTRAISFNVPKGNTIDEFLDRAIQQFEGRKGRIAFKIAGNPAHIRSFHNIRAAIDYLSSYKQSYSSWKEAIRKGEKAQRELISQITFYTTRRRM